MTATATPREVLETLLGHISAGRWTEIADLYAEHTVVDIPFALPAPERVEGREALRSHFASAVSGAVELKAYNVRVHETSDPEVVVGQFDYQGRIVPTDRAFDVANVQIMRVRDGLIVSSQDFHNHAVIAAASGRLPAVLAALDPGPAQEV